MSQLALQQAVALFVVVVFVLSLLMLIEIAL